MRALDHYRLLGRSGLRVSPLALGAMTFGNDQGWGSSDEEAAAILDLYIDRGGNFIDTANFYGASGRSEELLGQMLAGRRDRMIVATKYSLTMRPGDANASGNQRRNMVRAVEDSLRRLDTDYIDLFYLHVWDATTPVEEVLRGFDDLVRQGKIVHAGLSDIPAWQASRMQAIAEMRGWAPLIALQIPYSLIERTVERDLMPMALEMGMGVIPWSPLGGGVLSGKYKADHLDPASVEHAGSRHDVVQRTGRLNERGLSIAETARELAGEIGMTTAQVALAWTLEHPAVTAPIVGARTRAQLEENLGALNVRFDDGQRSRLNAISAVPKGFPHEMLESEMLGRMFGNVRIDQRQSGRVWP